VRYKLKALIVPLQPLIGLNL